MREFAHGGDIKSFAKMVGCKESEVIDLSSNINFVKPNVSFDFRLSKLFPYPNYDELYQEVAKFYKTEPENLELFNGATVAIDRVLESLRGEFNTISIYSPAYLEYKRVAKKYNYKIKLIDRLSSAKLPPKNSLVIFVNPSTPDGEFSDIKPLLKLCKFRGSTLVVDESFLEFYDSNQSATSLLDEFENLFVIKSMSKYFGLAGVRVGAVVANRNFINSLKEKEPLWKISSFDMEYILSSLKDRNFEQISKEQHRVAKEFLFETLSNSPLIEKVYSSQANFFLAKSKIKAKKLQEILAPKRVLIRECSNFDFLDESHFRVAVKDIDSLRVFKEAICE